MRVLLLSRYGSQGASSRVRSLQFLEYLSERGIEVDARPLFDARYVERVNRGKGRSWPGVLGAYAARLRALLGARRYDLVWLEKELFPGLPASAERLLARLGPPCLVDYDDAVFHRYEQGGWFARRFLKRKIDAVMRSAALVTVGNEYLAARARAAGAKEVALLPSVVVAGRFKPPPTRRAGPFTIGWMGSPRNSAYLAPLRAPLLRLAECVELRIVLVGADREAFAGLPVERRDWSLEREAADLEEFDVGIMPLPDAPFERGKCGYKLIQYMAAGVPFVASPVGVNVHLTEVSRAGRLARTEDEWEAVLTELAADPEERLALGRAGRAAVAERFSVARVAPLLEASLRRAASAANAGE